MSRSRTGWFRLDRRHGRILTSALPSQRLPQDLWAGVNTATRQGDSDANFGDWSLLRAGVFCFLLVRC